MKNLNRREFIYKGAVGLAGTAIIDTVILDNSYASQTDVLIDKVKLGETRMILPRLALGTGNLGVNKSSQRTRISKETFVEMARHAYERGVRFFDMADLYGTHDRVKQALKGIPREEITLLTKMWTSNENWNTVEPVEKSLDRFRVETGCDYFDILSLHCMQNGN